MTTTSDATRAGPGKVSGDRSALIAGAGCYILWSGLSLLFMALARRGVGSWEILAQRCLWALPWAAWLVWLARSWEEVWAALAQPRLLLWLACSALLISVNWTLFIVAATTGHKLDASLAYYLNPLLNMAAGAVLFRERFTRVGAVAVGLACGGVLLQGVAMGHPPWLALGMAACFWAYGVIRKRAPVGAYAGLFIECLMLAPLGLVYILWLGAHGVGHMGRQWDTSLLVLSTGPATAIPLALFAYAARKLPLSAMGFLQFITPTAIFGIAMATGEPLTPLGALSFVFIWSGVAVFAVASLTTARKAA
jgi:chloramphenicol-sensitive protein RarD